MMHTSEDKKEFESLAKALDEIIIQARAYETVFADHHLALASIAALRAKMEVVRNDLRRYRESDVDAETGGCSLTGRERQVLGLVAAGLGNKQIAYELAISERTVQFHLGSVFNKLSVQSRTEAVVQAVKKGLLEL